MKPTTGERISTDRRALRSSPWIFVLFNMLFRDIHEFARPGWIEQLMAMEVADGLLLASGIVLSLNDLDDRAEPGAASSAARRANVTVSIVAITGMVAKPPGDLDDSWFFAVEILDVLAIIGRAWTWRTDPIEGRRDRVGASVA
ncbi:MAG TPA: hypothetical protein VLG28_11520 [Acidimicrobiia bacterium]|nr:hypothetical protein [Acidimicrobiia bacterium]